MSAPAAGRLLVTAARHSATIVWLRRDLRLEDQPALCAAVARGGAVIPVFVLDDDAEGRWPLGAASRWWLHHSLDAWAARGRRRTDGNRAHLSSFGSAIVASSIADPHPRETGVGGLAEKR